MTHQLRPCAAYKASGGECPREVPNHWEVLRLRHVLRRHTERERPDLPLLSVVRERGVILRDTTSSDENHNYIPDDLSNYKVVRAGQFAMNKMKAWQGSYGVSCHDGIVSPAYFVFDVLGLEVDFFHTAIRSRAYVPAFTRASDGVRIGQWDLAEPRMREIQFLVPPAPDQAAIVRFLDYANRRIRRYIRAKQKLIGLLEEQKQALIHQAVTGQIDVRTGQPYPAYKPSGVAWLGEVPEHWDVRRIGGFCKVGNGSTPSRSNPAYWSGGEYPWLNSSSVNQGTVTRADQFVTHAALRECHLPRVPAASVLIGITGQGRTRGMAAVLAVDATINQHIAYIAPNTDKVSSRYLHMCLAAAYTELRAISSASGSTKGALTCEDIKSFGVVLPPKDEQEVLLLAVGREFASVGHCASLARRQVDLMQGYRTRLIADVVTGKVDVREAAAGLPEVDPLAAEDDPDDGFKRGGGSEEAVWQHGVEEGVSLADVSDAERSEEAAEELMTEGR